jgi:hypothetical protein
MAPALKLEDQAAGPPAAVSSAQVADHGLDPRTHRSTHPP